MRNTSKTKNSIGTNFKLIKLCDCFNFLAFLFLSSCLQMTNSKTMTDDFNFIAIYGIMERNTINTFNNTFTKILDWEKDTIVNFTLSSKQKEEIYKKIKKYRLDEYPSNFSPKSNKSIQPSPTYYLKFRTGGIVKEIMWEKNVNSKEKEAKHLRLVFEIIENIINEEKSICDLPSDKRGAL